MAAVAEDTTGTLQAAMQAIAVRDTRLAKSRAVAQTHALRVRVCRPLHSNPRASAGGWARARETRVDYTVRRLKQQWSMWSAGGALGVRVERGAAQSQVAAAGALPGA